MCSYWWCWLLNWWFDNFLNGWSLWWFICSSSWLHCEGEKSVGLGYPSMCMLKKKVYFPRWTFFHDRPLHLSALVMFLHGSGAEIVCCSVQTELPSMKCMLQICCALEAITVEEIRHVAIVDGERFHDVTCRLVEVIWMTLKPAQGSFSSSVSFLWGLLWVDCSWRVFLGGQVDGWGGAVRFLEEGDQIKVMIRDCCVVSSAEF